MADSGGWYSNGIKKRCEGFGKEDGGVGGLGTAEPADGRISNTDAVAVSTARRL